jgi:hypothetical protein
VATGTRGARTKINRENFSSPARVRRLAILVALVVCVLKLLLLLLLVLLKFSVTSGGHVILGALFKIGIVVLRPTPVGVTWSCWVWVYRPDRRRG